MAYLLTRSGTNIDFQSDHSATLYLSLYSGNVINFCLYGALTVQLYLYYVSFPEDRRGYKAVIYLVYLLETIYTVILMYDMGHLLLNPRTYISCIPMLVIPIAGGAVAILTQGMYAYRIGIISRRKVLSWGIYMFIVLQLIVTVFLIGFGIPFQDVALVWATSCLAVDLTIATIMVWSLSKDEIRSKQFKRKVTQLLYIIVGTGVLTAAVNVATVTVILTAPKIIYAPAIVLSKIYANSMMVLVNNRLSLSSQNKAFTMGQVPDVEISSFHAMSGMATPDNENQTDSKEPSADIDSDKQKV
ncbi:hypothetical protein AX15_006166 [Amanita polypyramis BW_CC]|nr:hypothetical protein AX15_006166 [Amanita polypyramis BW_CC]